MQIEVFSLCDAATIEGGKLNMLGAFDTIVSEEVPVIHPHCTIALRLRFNASEGEEHYVTLKLVDADGKHIIPAAKGAIKIKFSKEQKTSSANFVLNLQGLKFEQYDEFSINLSVDGKNTASVPLFVKKQIIKPAVI